MPRADGLHGSDGLPTSRFPHGGRLGLSPGSIEELTTFFSTPQLLRYYQSSGDSPDEMWALYKWNLEVSSAFQIPLHFCEISIRNAIADTFCEVHGERWPWADSLLYSLDKNSDDKLIESRIKFNNQGTGKVVADPNFIFLGKEYFHIDNAASGLTGFVAHSLTCRREMTMNFEGPLKIMSGMQDNSRTELPTMSRYLTEIYLNT